MHSRHLRTRAFPVLMMLTPLHLLSVYHNPSCDGYARDTEESRLPKKNLVDKRSQGMAERRASSIHFDKVKQ